MKIKEIMGIKFLHKTLIKGKPMEFKSVQPEVIEKSEEKPIEKVKNKKEKKVNTMTTMEAVIAAENAVENMQQEVKVVKKDRELIERAESSKIVLTEDNRQVLND